MIDILGEWLGYGSFLVCSDSYNKNNYRRCGLEIIEIGFL